MPLFAWRPKKLQFKAGTRREQALVDAAPNVDGRQVQINIGASNYAPQATKDAAAHSSSSSNPPPLLSPVSPEIASVPFIDDADSVVPLPHNVMRDRTPPRLLNGSRLFVADAQQQRGRERSPRNVRFQEGIGGGVQHQSNSTPTTPTVAPRPFASNGRSIPLGEATSPPTALTSPEASRPNLNTSGYPPPSYATAIAIDRDRTSSGGESPTRPFGGWPDSTGIGANRSAYQRNTMSHEHDFADNVVPPRPPRQQPFQRSNSAGSNGPRTSAPIGQLGGQHAKENRANLILQQLRADDGDQSESDVSAAAFRHAPPFTSNSAAMGRANGLLHSKGVVYLEFNREVKRSNLPVRLHTFEQLKSLFLRSFPALTLQFLNQPHVKIYVADRHSGGDASSLFYELEDLNDVKDQSVLKIHQSQGFRSPPPPLRFTDIPTTDYISEPEIEPRRYGALAHHRPASAVPDSNRTAAAVYGSPHKLSFKSNQMPAPTTSTNHFDLPYDPYYSDASSTAGPRSGSVTPIIDKETRQRVETMERQLAGLSTLVRSALVTRGVKDGSPDMMDLGRRLLEFHSDAERFGRSNVGEMGVCVMNGKQLLQVRRGVRDMKVNLNELRDFLEIDRQARGDIIRETFSKIGKKVAEFMAEQRTNENAQERRLLEQKRRHQVALKSLEDVIQRLESRIEDRRNNVLAKNHKLRMVEVDALQAELSGVDTQLEVLRSEFNGLESEVISSIEQHENAIARETEFLRRGPGNVENCNRRCIALSNMLATMKKLALVQDPTMYDRGKHALAAHPSAADKPPRVAPKPNGILSNGVFHGAPKSANDQLPPLPTSPPRNQNPIRSVSAAAAPAAPPTQTSAPPPPPTGASNPNGPNSNVLDSILDELNHTANSLPQVDQNGVPVALNGNHSPTGANRPGGKRVVEASATLTLKEPAKTAEKYDNIAEEAPPTAAPGARISSVDPRRFVTTETTRMRPGAAILPRAMARP